MREHPRAVAMVGVVLFLSGLFTIRTQAQNVPARPAPTGQYAIPIGRVENLVGEVRITHATGVLVQANTGGTIGDVGRTKRGDAVYQGDIIQTGANSKLGIAFTDGTAFNLSSNARMVLDQYVYDPNGKSNSTLFSLSKGAFTFIAGKVARTGDMKVNTPMATMGIRGTAPHVEISEDGTVKFSTLIEENKNADKPGTGPQKHGALIAPKGSSLVRRQAKLQSSPSELRREQAEKDFDKRLNICHGC